MQYGNSYFAIFGGILRHMKKSLANKLLAYFLLLNLISIMIMAWYAYSKAKDALLSRTFDQLVSVRIEKSKRIQDYFAQRIHEIKTLEEAALLSEGLEPKQISNTILQNPGLDAVLSNNNNYNFLYSYRDRFTHHALRNIRNGQNFQSIIFDREHLTLFDSLVHRPINQVFLVEFKNISSGNNEILFYRNFVQDGDTTLHAFSLNKEKINNIMLDHNPQNGLGNSGEAYLVGEDYLLRSNSRFEENSAYRIAANTKGVQLAFEDSTNTAVIQDYRDIKVLSSFSKLNIPQFKWVVLAEIDYKEAMIPIRSYGYSIIYITLILSLLLLGIVATLANTITASLRRLKRGTEKISEGDYTPLEDTKADGEIKDLIESYNQMLTKIKEQQENLRVARNKSISAMLDGQEIERNRLAMELHDGLAQTILAIKMRLENTAPEKAASVLLDSKDMFADLMREIRSISNDLMPAVLREFGLRMALESLLNQIKSNAEIYTSFITNMEDFKFDKKVETYLYRIAQEAANNLIKHSEATRFSILLNENEGYLFFELKDNGKGLDKDSLHKNTSGMANIQERVSLLGGIVYFYDSKPHGLHILCKIPIDKCSANED
jgi:signal transduction histidine kinase